MANNYQGFYAALPQTSLSDSDSDKEMAAIAQPESFNDDSLQNGDLDSDMMKLEDYEKEYELSAKRKFLLCFTIALCIFTLVAFIWALPCSKKGTCPKRLTNWEIQHDGIELTGKINVVKSAFESTQNIVLFFERNLLLIDSHGGLISMLGTNGIIAWYVAQARIPKHIECYEIDANEDGVFDCVLLGDVGLEAVDPLSGLILWHACDRVEKKIMRNLDFPYFVDDLNNDKVKELLTVGNGVPYPPRFLLISGKIGSVIGEIYAPDCDEIHIADVNAFEVTYICRLGTRSAYHQVQLSQLINNMFKKVESFSSPETTFVQPTTTYTLTGHKLMINNVGSCPNCHVDIALVDNETNDSVISWSYPNSYAFVPVFFSFKSPQTAISLSGHVNGFILKLWQYFGFKPRDTLHRYAHNISKRSVPPANGTLQINSIMERIVLVTFNDTDFNVVNASLNEVTQLCFPDDYVLCQPSMENQNNSLLITDIDSDGSQELISYSSSFVRRNDSKDNWHLVSTMKLIRLEAELPKLYGAPPKVE